ncbi:hypothetical protein [Rhizobium redzepovicii]|uniref:hypothetical protein n=1 Tax=Rhizobium redzepovicii TaxID=2867518 RepID=UPI0028716AA5|nr:hypothetical protein [Rhizobium redzepovicii]MDR9781628.1 hypothetical protein [Rhizobium redzepovicii]
MKPFNIYKIELTGWRVTKMAEADDTNVNYELLTKFRSAVKEATDGSLHGGGGGGTFEGMEARVKALEDDMKKILQDTAEIKGMLRAAPSAVDFGELKGRVNSLPTTAKVAVLLSVATAVIGIFNNWSLIKAALFH